MMFPKISARKKTITIALICGVGCALCVGLYIVSVDEQANAAQAEMLAKYGGDQVEVCIARRDINVGETIAESDIETKTWVASLLPADAVTIRGDAIGKQVGSTILSGEVISSKRFGFKTAEIDVPEGYSAVCVPAKQIQAVGGALKAGMRADVYSVGANETKRMVDSALILATSSTEDSASSNAWITLALLPSQVEQMVSAAQNLDLYFVLPSGINSEDGTGSEIQAYAKDESRISDEHVSGSSLQEGSGQKNDSQDLSAQAANLSSKLNNRTDQASNS